MGEDGDLRHATDAGGADAQQMPRGLPRQAGCQGLMAKVLQPAPCLELGRMEQAVEVYNRARAGAGGASVADCNSPEPP